MAPKDEYQTEFAFGAGLGDTFQSWANREKNYWVSILPEEPQAKEKFDEYKKCCLTKNKRARFVLSKAVDFRTRFDEFEKELVRSITNAMNSRPRRKPWKPLKDQNRVDQDTIKGLTEWLDSLRSRHEGIAKAEPRDLAHAILQRLVSEGMENPDSNVDSIWSDMFGEVQMPIAEKAHEHIFFCCPEELWEVLKKAGAKPKESFKFILKKVFPNEQANVPEISGSYRFGDLVIDSSSQGFERPAEKGLVVKILFIGSELEERLEAIRENTVFHSLPQILLSALISFLEENKSDLLGPYKFSD